MNPKVGRVSAKMRRDLTPQDFTAAHKLVFDMQVLLFFKGIQGCRANRVIFRTGNELTPGVKYDFKFKDYAPWVFRYLREEFHIDAADYMVGRSGSRECDRSYADPITDVFNQQVHPV